MIDWFAQAFGEAVSDIRHELMGGWFGRHFEPHPSRQHGFDHDQPDPGDRDIHGNGHDLDR